MTRQEDAGRREGALDLLALCACRRRAHARRTSARSRQRASPLPLTANSSLNAPSKTNPQKQLFGGGSVPSVAPAALTSATPVPAAAPAPPSSASAAAAGFTSVPLSSAAAAAPPAPTSTSHPMTGFGGGGGGSSLSGNTLDEPVLQTLKRDALTIGRNLRAVLVPVGWDFSGGGNAAALQNWDLWGPLIFMLALAITLSVGEKEPSEVFALVFTEVAVGSMVLTANVVLLGGSIVFFQSLCLMGYCLFPVCLAAVVCVFVRLMWARTLALVAALAWASAAAVPFVGRSVRKERRALAVYPVLLMYVSIGWLALVKR